MSGYYQEKRLYTLSSRFLLIILSWGVFVVALFTVQYPVLCPDVIGNPARRPTGVNAELVAVDNASPPGTPPALTPPVGGRNLDGFVIVDASDRIVAQGGVTPVGSKGVTVTRRWTPPEESGPVELRLSPNLPAFRIRYISAIAPWIVTLVLALIALQVALFLILRSRYLRPLRELTFSVRDNRIDVLTEIARRTGAVEFHTMIASFIGLMNQTERRTEELQATVKEHSQELERAQAQMIRQEKLASLGRLAAGVAHEINNPSGFIVGNLEVLSGYIETIKSRLRRCDSLMEELAATGGATISPTVRATAAGILKDEESEEYRYIMGEMDDLISAVTGGMQRITTIVQGLNAFARDKAQEMERVDLNHALESGVQIVWNELKYDYTVEVDADDRLATTAVPGQIEQVIVNMLINARDATPPGGTISISLREEEGNAVLRISDTGCGMTEETIAKIFDPFYTTKPVGAGTGLGLAICHEIITNSGGTISVESVPDEGTTFVVTMPLTPFPLEEIGESDGTDG